MNQEQLQETFRKAELERREARRKVILNTAALNEEPLTLEEQQVTAKALGAIRTAREEYEKATRPRHSYWKTLWLALFGRL